MDELLKEKAPPPPLPPTSPRAAELENAILAQFDTLRIPIVGIVKRDLPAGLLNGDGLNQAVERAGFAVHLNGNPLSQGPLSFRAIGA